MERLDKEKINCIYCQNKFRYWETKTKKNETKLYPIAPSLFPGSAIFFLNKVLTTLPALSSMGEWSMEGCSQYVTVPLCCSFLLILFSCSNMESLLWDKILQDKNASAWTFHRLQILQEMSTCSGVGSSMAHSTRILYILYYEKYEEKA